jgi:XTP/dITP diphosphohydrolase
VARVRIDGGRLLGARRDSRRRNPEERERDPEGGELSPAASHAEHPSATIAGEAGTAATMPGSPAGRELRGGPSTMRLLLATTNAKKRAELERVLSGLGIEVLTSDQVGGIPPVEEDEPTFAGNARKKAASAARASGLWALADDSGLEVDALGDAPGVRSARYAGEPADDRKNNAKLLAELAGVPTEQRGARFVCALALARPDGSIALELAGEARGRILEAPRGATGFGYDPLFLPAETSPGAPVRSFAELSPAEKDAQSHRGRALRELARRLPEVAPVGSGSAARAKGAPRT